MSSLDIYNLHPLIIDKFGIDAFKILDPKFREIVGRSAKFIGQGGEGFVYLFDNTVNKVIFNWFGNRNINYTYKFLKKLDTNNRTTIYPFKVSRIKSDIDLLLIQYSYEKSIPYNGGHPHQLFKFASEAHQCGFIYTNIKYDNFRNVNSNIKLIDYGCAMLPYNDESFEKMIKRLYLICYHSKNSNLNNMLKFYLVDDGFSKFKKQISKSLF